MLPDPNVRHLKRSPIELVVFELLLPPGLEPLSAAQILELKEAVTVHGWTATRFESAFRRNLKLKLEPGEMLADEARGWTLIGQEDPPVTTSIFPTVVNIQANRYSSWRHSLRQTFEAVITAMHEVMKPPPSSGSACATSTASSTPRRGPPITGAARSLTNSWVRRCIPSSGRPSREASSSWTWHGRAVSPE